MFFIIYSYGCLPVNDTFTQTTTPNPFPFSYNPRSINIGPVNW